MTADEVRLKRQPTDLEAAVLTCAQAIDRLGETIEAIREHDAAMLQRIEELLSREQWIESYRADDRAFEALRDL